jgi:gas vesicle protein GvpA/GvpJ/GvpM family
MSPPRPSRPSTVPVRKPKHERRAATPLPPPAARPQPPPRPSPPRPPRHGVASIIDQSATSLVDVIDNLLNRGVVLNADLILALADVDLVYVRLSALLCAADRVLPGAR